MERNGNDRLRTADPLDLVEDTGLPYEARLHELQRRLAALGDDEPARRLELEAAVQSLQAGAKLRQDEPEEAPGTHTYGAVERSDLRHPGWRARARRLWRRLGKGIGRN